MLVLWLNMELIRTVLRFTRFLELEVRNDEKNGPRKREKNERKR